MKTVWMVAILTLVGAASAFAEQQAGEALAEGGIDRLPAEYKLPPEPCGLENASLNEDGSNPAFCTQPDDQCAFKEKVTGILVSSIALGQEPVRPGRLVLRNFHESQKYCRENTWAGYKGWRLPSYNELEFLKVSLKTIASSFPFFGGNNAYLWTMGFPNAYGKAPVVFDEKKSWVQHVETDRSQQLPKTSKATFRCVRNEAENLWDDVTLGDDKKRTTCTEPGRYCLFRHRATKLIYSGPQTFSYERDGRGVRYDEAVKFCNGLSFVGDVGWRLPTYEEGHTAAKSMFYGYALSRDGLQEQPRGDFWVSEPKVDDEPCNVNESYQQIDFKGYVCNFLTQPYCKRILNVGQRNRSPYQAPPVLPRANVLCVKRY